MQIPFKDIAAGAGTVLATIFGTLLIAIGAIVTIPHVLMLALGAWGMTQIIGFGAGISICALGYVLARHEDVCSWLARLFPGDGWVMAYGFLVAGLVLQAGSLLLSLVSRMPHLPPCANGFPAC